MNRSVFLLVLGLFSPALLPAFNQFATYQDAAFYHYNSRPQWELAFQILRDYPLKGNETILNVGCRSGRVAAYLANKLNDGKVIAIDSNDCMIEFAGFNFCPRLYSNLRFIQNDTLENYFSNVIDVAVSFSSLHWFPEQKIFLSKLHQALKPGGKVLFLIPATPVKEVSDVFADLSAKEEWRDYFKNYVHPRKKYTAEEYRSLLQEAGFKEIEIDVIPFHYAFDTKRDLIDWWGAFSPFLRTLPIEKRCAFLSDFCQCFIRHHPLQTDSRIPFTENHLFVRAVK